MDFRNDDNTHIYQDLVFFFFLANLKNLFIYVKHYKHVIQDEKEFEKLFKCENKEIL